MTEHEALKFIKDANRTNHMVGILPKSDIGKCLIKTLEEIQKYLTIGTPEECRAAVEVKEEIRNKAIDDFVEKAIKQFTDFELKHGYPTVTDCKVILRDVAEQMKGSAADE